MRRTFYFLIGNPEQFTLEHRVFNAICVILLVVLGYNVPFNYLVGLKETSLIFMVFLTVFGMMYYWSRFKHKLTLAISIAAISASLLFAINYFFSSGIRGASLLSFTLTFFLIMVASPVRYYVWWLILNLVIVIGIIVAEYYNADLVVTMYGSRQELFVDMTSTYLINVAVIFIGTLYIKRAYNTEKKTVQEKTAALEKMNAEKSKLFSIISHDLRSPLHSIQGYLELMREAALDQEDKDRIELELLSMVNGTQEMLYNMLSWSKNQMDGVKVNIVPTNVARVIQPVVEVKKMLMLKKTIELEDDIDPSISVNADINMLQLIVRNIIGNAIKFTPSGGNIYIKAMRSENDCLIVVRDNGNGIEETNKPDIFSLKMQSTFGTNNEKGVGLGLFLCKEYTEAQGGKIWFESNKGIGSTFYISLPLAN
ncbi:sensor histidine kinase [Chitinophaga defluvii]|uniref:histidine kinase n=1 Tax=Chitinophaga defluvii TaxID=3163343 RepID=A0ABV2T1H4_9BACT